MSGVLKTFSNFHRNVVDPLANLDPVAKKLGISGKVTSTIDNMLPLTKTPGQIAAENAAAAKAASDAAAAQVAAGDQAGIAKAAARRRLSAQQSVLAGGSTQLGASSVLGSG